MKSGAAPVANKVILKLVVIAHFNNEAAAEGPNNTSRNCPTTEVCIPMIVSLCSSCLS